jgi:DUF1680 family protein
MYARAANIVSNRQSCDDEHSALCTERFRVVPTRAGPNTSISVNGKRDRTEVRPGTFHAIRRTWKNGDKIEFEIDQRIGTQAIDAQTPDQIAILRGCKYCLKLRMRRKS